MRASIVATTRGPGIKVDDTNGRIALLSTASDPLLGHVLARCAERRTPLAAVILDDKGFSTRDREIHRQRTGGRMRSIPIANFERAIAFHRVKNHSSAEAATLVRQLQIDVLGNAGTPRILGDEILAAPTLGVVNCHPGILPRFRGRTCVEWAVYLDEPVGLTTHFMTSGVDEGPIIDQEWLGFSRLDDYVSVRVKVYEASIDLLVRTLRKVVDERLRPSMLPPQAPGTFFDVIDDDKMKAVVEKLASGTYAYQRD